MKTEFEAGEVFQCGLIKLKVNKAKGDSCDGCFFKPCSDQAYRCYADIVGTCLKSYRADNKSIIFVKAED